MSAVVYITIGNSDDKLSQRRWSDFAAAVYNTCRESATVRGAWPSDPLHPWQNMTICVELSEGVAVTERLRRRLRHLAREYEQDSIAWAVCPETEQLTPTPEDPGGA